jgi:hypothetical protein
LENDDADYSTSKKTFFIAVKSGDMPVFDKINFNSKNNNTRGLYVYWLFIIEFQKRDVIFEKLQFIFNP